MTGFQGLLIYIFLSMNRSLASFSESKKHISLSCAFKHPFICAHLQSVTIFLRVVCIHFTAEWWLLFLPGLFSPPHSRTTAHVAGGHISPWIQIICGYENYSKCFSIIFFFYIVSCTILFCTPGNVLKPLCFTLNMRNLPMSSVFILREKWFLLQLVLKSQMQVYDHGKDLCLAPCMCVFNVLTA